MQHEVSFQWYDDFFITMVTILQLKLVKRQLFEKGNLEPFLMKGTWGTLNISSDFPLKAKSLQLFFISDVCKYKRWICFSSVWYWRYVHVAVQFLDFLKFAFWNFQMIDLLFFHLRVWVYETEGSVHEDFFCNYHSHHHYYYYCFFVIICKKTQPV